MEDNNKQGVWWFDPDQEDIKNNPITTRHKVDGESITGDLNKVARAMWRYIFESLVKTYDEFGHSHDTMEIHVMEAPPVTLDDRNQGGEYINSIILHKESETTFTAGISLTYMENGEKESGCFRLEDCNIYELMTAYELILRIESEDDGHYFLFH